MIGIVGVLAAVLCSAVIAARESGASTGCMSNLRQLYSAFHLYANDNDGYAPPFQNRLGRAVPENGALLVTSLASYARSTQIWFCPADPYAGTVSTVGDVRHRYTSYRTGLAAGATVPYPLDVTMDG